MKNLYNSRDPCSNSPCLLLVTWKRTNKDQWLTGYLFLGQYITCQVMKSRI